ncbi:MAG: hypothetical protein MZV49_02650 [Rhodopseudomonas palustris]|nr:hypothetical protein [Rhodopseudomonas palustris]
MKGHVAEIVEADVQGGRPARASSFHAETTDKLMLFATNGRFYTLDAAKLPGGRGHGEPVRLMIDHRAGRPTIVAALRPQAGPQAAGGRPTTATASSCPRTRCVGADRARASRC